MKKAKKKSVKKPREIRRHRFTLKQEDFLAERIPESGKFGREELGELRKMFNSFWGTKLSTRCIGNKCRRLRVKKSLKELKTEQAKIAVAKKTPHELHKDLIPIRAVITEIVDDTESPPTPEFIVVIQDNGGKVIWRGDHCPKPEVFQKVQPKK